MTRIQTMKYLLLKSLCPLPIITQEYQLLHSFQLHWLNTAKACQAFLPDRHICSSICSAHTDCFASAPEENRKRETAVGYTHCRYQLKCFWFASKKKKIYIYIYLYLSACHTKMQLFWNSSLDKSNTIITRRVDPLWKLKLLKDVLKQICSLPFLKLLERYLQFLEWVSKFFWASVFERPWKISCWKTKHVLQLAEHDLKRKLCWAVCLRKIKIKHLLNWKEVAFISIIKWQSFERLCHRNRIFTTKKSPWS